MAPHGISRPVGTLENQKWTKNNQSIDYLNCVKQNFQIKFYPEPEFFALAKMGKN